MLWWRRLLLLLLLLLLRTRLRLRQGLGPEDFAIRLRDETSSLVREKS